MCETQDIRYIHHMEHPDHPESLEVGCVCAEHMENDYEGPRRRERALRKRRWLTRRWKTSAKDNDYLNTDGMNITNFQRSASLWGARIEERATGGNVPTDVETRLGQRRPVIIMPPVRGGRCRWFPHLPGDASPVRPRPPAYRSRSRSAIPAPRCRATIRMRTARRSG